jgi:hypothetical protein
MPSGPRIEAGDEVGTVLCTALWGHAVGLRDVTESNHLAGFAGYVAHALGTGASSGEFQVRIHCVSKDDAIDSKGLLAKVQGKICTLYTDSGDFYDDFFAAEVDLRPISQEAWNGVLGWLVRATIRGHEMGTQDQEES